MRRKCRCLVAQRSNAIWVFLVRFEDSSLVSADACGEQREGVAEGRQPEELGLAGAGPTQPGSSRPLWPPGWSRETDGSSDGEREKLASTILGRDRKLSG